jgi:hypothetical protein
MLKKKFLLNGHVFISHQDLANIECKAQTCQVLIVLVIVYKEQYYRFRNFVNNN